MLGNGGIGSDKTIQNLKSNINQINLGAETDNFLKLNMTLVIFTPKK